MAAKKVTNVFPIAKKYTQESTGIWDKIRRAFAVDPDRSSGIPVKHFRNPTPGGLDPKAYDDVVTFPAGDIADNPYWRRDMRRSYPKLSAVTQGDAVALLTVGNAASPSPKLLAGAEGSKQLVVAKEEGEKGLAAYFEKEKGAAVLGQGGMPPMPPSFKAPKVVDYALEPEQTYGDQYVRTCCERLEVLTKCRYPCRTFS